MFSDLSVPAWRLHLGWTSTLTSYKSVGTMGSRALRDHLQESVGTTRVMQLSMTGADRAR